MNEPLNPNAVFRSSFLLRYADVDATGRLGLAALLDYLAQTAGDQTEALSFGYKEQLAQGVFWVLSRLSLQIDTWPTWPATVEVDTWARSIRGLLAFRDFRVSWGCVCARSSSAWVLLKNQRPQRPEPWTAIYDLVRPEPPLAEVPVLLESNFSSPDDRAQSLCQRSLTIQATWDDLDMNGHVNNRRAILWCLGAHSLEFLKTHEIAELDVNFLSQMFAEHEYRLCWQVTDTLVQNTWDYGLFPSESDKPSLRLRITWRECLS